MKQLITFLLFLCATCSISFAQGITPPQGVVRVTALPATCVAVGADNSSAPVRYRGVVYTCTATNTWSDVTGTVAENDIDTLGKDRRGVRAYYAVASLPTCNSARRDITVNVTDGNKGQRTCRNTAGSTYAWVDDDPVFNVERFGAVHDGVTDDTPAIILAGNALQAAGKGTLLFPPGNYLIFKNGITYLQSPVELSSVSNVKILGQGATLTLDPVRSWTGATGAVFNLISCNNIEIDGFYVTGPDLSVSAGIYRGVTVIQASGNGSGLRIPYLKVNSMGAGIIFNLPTSPTSTVRNINIGTMDVTNSFYGINCQDNGNYLTVDNLTTNLVYRSFFVYGVSHMRAVINSKNSVGPVDVPICTSTAGYATVEDYDITYNNDNTTIGSGAYGVYLSFNQGESVVGTIKDIRVKLNVKHGATGAMGPVFTIYKGKNDGTGDAVDRGHTLRNITISGDIVGTPSVGENIQLGHSGTTWGADENVNAVEIRNLKITGDSNTNGIFSRINASLESNLTFTNVETSNAIDITTTSLTSSNAQINLINTTAGTKSHVAKTIRKNTTNNGGLGFGYSLGNYAAYDNSTNFNFGFTDASDNFNNSGFIKFTKTSLGTRFSIATIRTGVTFGERLTVDETGAVTMPVSLTIGPISGSANPLAITGATTGYSFGSIANTGGTMRWGVEDGAGGGLVVGGSAYAGVVGVTGATPFQIYTSNTVRATFSSSGVLSLLKTLALTNATVTATSGGTTTLDLSLGNIRTITMPAGNTTLALSDVPVGVVDLAVIQDGTGGRTITFPSTMKNGTATLTLQPSPAASSRTQYRFQCDGTNCQLAGYQASGGPVLLCAGTATLSSGTVTVSNSCVRTPGTNTIIQLTPSGSSTGVVRVSATTANTSFVITSTDAGSSDSVYWSVFGIN